jgi:hypothetical protein
MSETNPFRSLSIGALQLMFGNIAKRKLSIRCSAKWRNGTMDLDSTRTCGELTRQMDAIASELDYREKMDARQQY